MFEAKNERKDGDFRSGEAYRGTPILVWFNVPTTHNIPKVKNVLYTKNIPDN